MKCQSCGSEHILSIYAHSRDCNKVELGEMGNVGPHNQPTCQMDVDGQSHQKYDLQDMQTSLALSTEQSPPDWRIFPKTRYQGSKRKLLPSLYRVFSSITFNSAIDLYSGSGTVTLLLRLMGKSVVPNDYMLYNSLVGRLFVEAQTQNFIQLPYKDELHWLLHDAPIHQPAIVCDLYNGVYFKTEENIQIDRFAQNVCHLDDFRRALYIYSVGQALIMKRPFGLFHRANLSMRERTVPRSFGNAKTWETPIYVHACKIIEELSRFPFPELQSTPIYMNHNTNNLSDFPIETDLIYLDPPYMNSKGVGVDYSNFYNFLEGLCSYDFYKTGDVKYPHRPIALKPTAWTSRAGAIDELSRISAYWTKSTLVLSYRGDGVPSKNEIISTFQQDGREVINGHAEQYKYALSINKDASEHIILALPAKA